MGGTKKRTRTVQRKGANESMSSKSSIPFRLHPRVFAALGKDLVTSDIVAVIELVKNSYDAFASRVDVNLLTDPEGGKFLEIKDDGVGMTRDLVENVWCVVATPYRLSNPEVVKGEARRRTSGEKGLGRLSAARLGSLMELRTRAEGESPLEVEVDWDALSRGDDLSDCTVELTEASHPSKVPVGTRIRIHNLSSDWGTSELDDLEDSLSRLLSPFSKVDQFKIFVGRPDSEEQSVVTELKVPKFLTKPKYALRGHVDSYGTIHAKYQFVPINGGSPRIGSHTLTWEQIKRAMRDSESIGGSTPDFGKFEFELRVWDIGSEDTQEIAEKFSERKSEIRKAIKANKGISLYRDNILVLPKSDDARDWLGLDLRRISKVGERLSTSQIVGYVSITADDNPSIEDTSNREGLARNSSVSDFFTALRALISILETERTRDRSSDRPVRKLEDLFDSLSAQDILSEVELLSSEGELAEEALPAIRVFTRDLANNVKSIKERFVYYSQLATIGTISYFLLHEIRNRTTAIARALRYFSKSLDVEEDETGKVRLVRAQKAVETLESLSDTFLPLASRGFRRRRKKASLEESIVRCIDLVQGEIAERMVELKIPKGTKTTLAVDPGELDTIILNLLNNSLYWLAQIEGQRTIEVQVTVVDHGAKARIRVHDSGSGVPDADSEAIFRPGVTRKPNGIGMGLTIVGELVAGYGGSLALVVPPKLGGASFVFDLPTK